MDDMKKPAPGQMQAAPELQQPAAPAPEAAAPTAPAPEAPAAAPEAAAAPTIQAPAANQATEPAEEPAVQAEPAQADQAEPAEAAQAEPAEPAEPAEATQAEPAEEPAEPAEAAQTEPAEALPQTKAGIIERLRAMAEAGDCPQRAQLDQFKQQYYKLRGAEVAAARDAFVAAGGESEAFMPPADTDEEAFKAQMNRMRELRAEATRRLEEQKQEGYRQKLDIIEQVKQMAATPDDADKHYEAFKQLQARWREIKLVPAEHATELWKNYQHYVDQFYDQLHLNHEFRDYDFRKNLEIKTRLCEAAEHLADVADPVSAFHQLQKLHQEFRETGPVARDLREALWARFKEASTAVNKRHQAHFEGLKAREGENLEQKTALCEKAEAISTDGLASPSQWEAATRQMLELQAQWKTIGFTPRRDNARIFERFRAACDKFFGAKTAFFRSQREQQQANQRLKNELCQRAEALSESTDWAATTTALVALQQEWKTIGPTAHKASETLWRRFNAACNKFFERKAEASSSQRREEQANLEQKEDIIRRLEQLKADAQGADVQSAARQLQAEWQAVGHVPFRKKEAIYRRYREALDTIFPPGGATRSRQGGAPRGSRRPEAAGTPLERELARLRADADARRAEIRTYETNLTFLSSKSAQAGSLVQDVTRRVERLRADLAAIEQKIRATVEQIRAEQKAAEE